MMATTTEVSVLGLGLMGAAMARAFIRKGHSTTVWNRSASKTEALKSAGAHAATSAETAAKASPLVILVLKNPDAILDALSGSAPVTDGTNRVIVDFTTSTASQVAQVSELVRRLGYSTYIHAAILAFPRHVGMPDAVSMYSGDHAAFKSVEKVLSALGYPLYLDDEEASSAVREAVLLTQEYASWTGFLQSIALLRTTRAFKQGSITATSYVQDVLKPLQESSLKTYEAMAKEIDAQDYATKGDGAKLSLHLSSLQTFTRTNTEQDLSTEMFDPIMRWIEKSIDQGGSDNELSSLVEIISARAGAGGKVS